jgi:anti-sigma factor RsiW
MWGGPLVGTHRRPGSLEVIGMTCHEAEKIAAGLVRGEIEATAAAHIAGCPACRERLAEEQRLSAGLAAWADACESEEAPAALEAKLLAEFRRTTAPPPAFAYRKWLLPLAAAAAALVSFLIPERPAPKVIPAQPLVATVAEPPPAIEQAPALQPPKPQPRRLRRAAQALREVPVAQPAAPQFLPVPQGDRWTPADGGKLVRVGLPRTALRHFGLPMLEERAQEQVQADVLLSNDGLVRAIRFVP